MIDGLQLTSLSAIWFLSDTKLSQHVTATLKSLYRLLLQLGIDWKILLLYLVTQLSINRSQMALWLVSRRAERPEGNRIPEKISKKSYTEAGCLNLYRMHGSWCWIVTWQFGTYWLNSDAPTRHSCQITKWRMFKNNLIILQIKARAKTKINMWCVMHYRS